MSRQDDTDRFYAVMELLSSRCGGPRLLRDATTATGGHRTASTSSSSSRARCRRNGKPRVARIGTHSLRPTSRTNLWKRLSQHRGRVGGRTPGGGNHRGSIFR